MIANPLADALARVGDRWSLLVVDALGLGPQRFAELQEGVTGIATNVLTQRLRQLEADGLVLAVPYSERPVRYRYQLTETGRDLGGALRSLSQWGADHSNGPSQTPAHPTCGTPMVARWWCPTCEEPGDDDAVIWV